ncbi:MAG: hypothetical protein HN952_05345 [Candidatus Cloacimonetes bacterium]|jgi:tRNA U34 5-methylaminomethyl-2-thiouridine-forming methyltransferase MnmC|nr:hypothetical protein [Candidatus Cloacimonadota bacterium]MBT6994366.1 hypothetical protein [Candidatus Cloacimonadota bacterium]MBT7469656.1 hypothetical protein [Candidatus Cloacimonadota bacterium]
MPKFVLTQDGSFTAFNEQFSEHYHSISGAFEEALEKHVNALKVEDGMHILDFCFGLGYNSFVATINHKNLQIIGLENDLNILTAISEIEAPKKLQKSFYTFAKIAEKQTITDDNNNQISLRIGDAKNTVALLNSNHFDRVFFDPFSPQKQPEMWTVEIFTEIFRIMKKGAKLSTYSCAKIVRKNMEIAGFSIIDGPKIGRKSPATIATKK